MHHSASKPKGGLGTVVVGALMLALCSINPAPAGAQAPQCDGRTATIVAVPGRATKGTDGNDVIVGTSGRDVIKGLDGDDVICGLGGNDKILGGRGNDTLLGGSGKDKLIGNAGVDRLSGSSGRDNCVNDRVDFLSGCETKPKKKSSIVDRICGKVLRAEPYSEWLEGLPKDPYRFSAYTNVRIFGTSYDLVLQTLFDGFHIEGWFFNNKGKAVGGDLIPDDVFFEDLFERRHQVDVDLYRNGDRTCVAS